MDILNLAGLSYNKPINEYGNTNRTIQATKFEEDLKLLLTTERGTLIGNPDFGSDLYKYLFNANVDLTASLVRDEIKRCIEENFDFVIVKKIDIEFDRNMLNAKITYGLYMQSSEQVVVLSFMRGE